MHTTAMSDDGTQNGTTREIDGKSCIYYDGYWMRRYDVAGTSFAEKKFLIDRLTRRVFHHTEDGINTPAALLPEARRAYEQQTDPARKRVNAAMLAGALLHRAAEICTKLVELEQAGISVTSQNELVRDCGRCYLEASDLAKQVLHFSGEEGLDELWGEPFRVFSLPLDQFYEERYIKLAQAMAAIDSIGQAIISCFKGLRGFEALPDLVIAYTDAAKHASETSKSDPANFQIWPTYVVTGDAVAAFTPELPPNLDTRQTALAETSVQMIQRGRSVMSYIANSRVIMPTTTERYLKLLSDHHETLRTHYPRG